MTARVRSARSAAREAEEVVEELVDAFEALAPEVVLFFCSPRHDGAAISAGLRARLGAQALGCTSAGEFTQRGNGVDGVVALALSPAQVRRGLAALATFEDGVEVGVARAVADVERTLQAPLRSLDGSRWVGVVLSEGLGGHEEALNEALGNHAPLLSFVGGSAGDNLEFRRTRVFCNGAQSVSGAALLLMEAASPFAVVKTCSFRPTGRRFLVTRADAQRRVVYALDGRPVAQAYAEAVGTRPERLDARVFMRHPLGLMIEGQPWIRSPMQLEPDGGLKFYARVEQGLTVDLMEATDLVAETRRAMEEAATRLGAAPRAGVAFNCVLRRLELDAGGLHPAFIEALGRLETAGFHTYGESYLGHVNQTLTALLFA